MNNNGVKPGGDKLSFLKNKKNALLINKFLTKTFHMIEQCDASITTWSTDGLSFIIRDVDSFAKSVLPLYFKHSKFASFVRQLNFYSFRKLRAETDDRNNVRFAHEHFRRGQPELLHKITRITKSQEPSSSEMKSLKDNIFDLKKDIVSLSNRFDHRLKAMSSALEVDYKERMNNIAVSYQALSVLSVQMRNSPQSASLHPSKPDKVRIGHFVSSSGTGISPSSLKEKGKNNTNSSSSSSVDHIGISATINVSGNSASNIAGATTSSQTRAESTSSTGHLMCPLMTLSGVASAIIDNASKY